MKKLVFFSAIISLFLFACKKEFVSVNKEGSTKLTTAGLNLSHLSFGQVSKYVAYTANCEDMGNSFEFTGDTLVVKVVLEPDQLFLEENLTSHSTSFLNGEVTETFRYPIEFQEGRLVLKERTNSRLFFFYDSDFLPFDFPVLMPTAEQEDCGLNLGDTRFTGNELVQFPSFKVGPILLYHKAAVSCRPIIEGDGYLMYDANKLYLSHTITYWEFAGETKVSVNGWYLLE